MYLIIIQYFIFALNTLRLIDYHFVFEKVAIKELHIQIISFLDQTIDIFIQDLPMPQFIKI